jgi:hypothetical protein
MENRAGSDRWAVCAQDLHRLLVFSSRAFEALEYSYSKRLVPRDVRLQLAH